MRFVQLGLILPLLLAASSAQARPWKGITPGASAQAEVEKKFGEPKTRTKRGERTVLAYYGDLALEGTKQVQFHLDGGGVVQEITVFLTNPLDPETIEGTYGKPTQKTFIEDTFQKVWIFASQGVTIYWAKDGSGAEAISYGPSKAAGKPGPARPDAGKADPDAEKAPGKGN